MKVVGSIVDNLHYMFISTFFDQLGHPRCHDITNSVVKIPLADEEEDVDVHQVRHGTEDPPGSSATKRRSRHLFKSPAKKVILKFLRMLFACCLMSWHIQTWVDIDL